MSRSVAKHPASQVHGGDLADAVALSGAAAADWLDLSTGINPVPYPLPVLGDAVWHRLPGRAELAALLEGAADYYGAPAPDHVVAAPGSQALIQALPGLFAPARVAVVAPTYGEHVPAWRDHGHDVRAVATLEHAAPDEIAVVVNPNNPDGRRISSDALAADARRRAAAGGFLVVDEAFADVAPEVSVARFVGELPIAIVRSVGKFFGLAGLRLGFAIAQSELAHSIAARLGPWAVSGPAIAIGTIALADRDWQAAVRHRLERDTERLDAILADAGMKIIGGTSLYRLAESLHASAVFDRLLSHHVYVRRFPDAPVWLRFGLPRAETSFERLAAALRDMPR